MLPVMVLYELQPENSRNLLILNSQAQGKKVLLLIKTCEAPRSSMRGDFSLSHCLGHGEILPAPAHLLRESFCLDSLS